MHCANFTAIHCLGAAYAGSIRPCGAFVYAMLCTSSGRILKATKRTESYTALFLRRSEIG